MTPKDRYLTSISTMLGVVAIWELLAGAVLHSRIWYVAGVLTLLACIALYRGG